MIGRGTGEIKTLIFNLAGGLFCALAANNKHNCTQSYEVKKKPKNWKIYHRHYHKSSSLAMSNWSICENMLWYVRLRWCGWAYRSFIDHVEQYILVCVGCLDGEHHRVHRCELERNHKCILLGSDGESHDINSTPGPTVADLTSLMKSGCIVFSTNCGKLSFSFSISTMTL